MKESPKNYANSGAIDAEFRAENDDAGDNTKVIS